MQLYSCTLGVGTPVHGCVAGRVVSTAPAERVRGSDAKFEIKEMVWAGVPWKAWPMMPSRNKA